MDSLDVSDAPEDVSARLDKLAQENKDCVTADFTFGS